MKEGLTQLERELLSYVETLSASCEAFATELQGLEHRYSSRITPTLNGLADCVTLLVRSQSVLVDALQVSLSQSTTSPSLSAKLQENFQQLKRAESLLSKSAREI